LILFKKRKEKIERQREGGVERGERGN